MLPTSFKNLDDAIYKKKNGNTFKDIYTIDFLATP